MRRRSTLLLVAPLAVAVFLVGGTTSLGRTGCSLTVDPRTGPPGTQFVFTGTGFSAPQLTLTSDTGASRAIPFAMRDPFTLGLIAADDDVGRWRAGGVGCSGLVAFRVTEPAAMRALEPEPGEGPDRTPALAVLAGLAVLLAAAGAILLPRLARHALSR